MQGATHFIWCTNCGEGELYKVTSKVWPIDKLTFFWQEQEKMSQMHYESVCRIVCIFYIKMKK